MQFAILQLILVFLYVSVGSKTSPNPNLIRQLRFKRQIPNEQNSEDQTYDLEISFPTRDTDEVINDEGRRQKLTELFERLLQSEQLDVSNQLPNTNIDDDSFTVDQAFACDEGSVVRENECGRFINIIFYRSYFTFPHEIFLSTLCPLMFHS